jgi:hypothetical protein
MRAAIVLTTLCALAAGAPALAGNDRFELNLNAVLPGFDVDEPVSEGPDIPASAVPVDPEQEFRLALWNSPLGRVHYQLASEQSMLGREGLVGGGHALGAGLSMYAIGGAGSQPPLLFPTREHPWREWSTKEKVKAAAYGGIVAAILWQLVEMAD